MKNINSEIQETQLIQETQDKHKETIPRQHHNQIAENH